MWNGLKRSRLVDEVYLLNLTEIIRDIVLTSRINRAVMNQSDFALHPYLGYGTGNNETAALSGWQFFYQS